MTARKTITKKTRFEVFKRDSFKCQYCGKSAPEVILHIDHIKPVSNGGDNNIMNLITSCFDCNMGKSDRLLSDHSIMQKQKEQLDELNEKRLQLEMMLKWREGLDKLKDKEVNFIVKRWNAKTSDGFTLNGNGLKALRTMLKKYTVSEIVESMDAAFDQYVSYDKEGRAMHESIEKAWKMIAKICSVKKQGEEKPYLKDLYYIRGILKNRLHYMVDYEALNLLEKAYLKDASLDSLQGFAKTVKNWTAFVNGINDYLEQQKDDDEDE